MKRCLCVLMLLALLPLAACGQAKPAALPSAASTTTPTATTTTAAATTTTQTAMTTTAAAVVTTTAVTTTRATTTVRTTTTAVRTTTTTVPVTTRTTLPPPTAAPSAATTATDSVARSVRVICVGDSITKNGYWEHNLLGALPQNYTVEGFGVNAATALRNGMKNDGTPMGYVGTEVYADSLKTAPDIVVIMLGTNDAKPVNWDGIADNPRRFIADTVALVRTYQQLGSAPTVFLALPPTVHKPYSTITEEALVQKVIPALRQAAEDTGALLIDTHTATKDAGEHFRDGVHPSDDVGRKCIADEIAAAILTYVTSEKTEKTEKTEGTVCNG